MKKLLLTLSFLAFAVPAQADMPEYMKDGVITVTLKDGNVYTFSTNEYKVVRRGQPASVLGQVQLRPIQVVEEKVEEKDANYSYSVILHTGLGRDGLSTGHNGSQYYVTERDQSVLGLTFCANDKPDRTKLRMGICGTALTNSTFLFGLKLDFE
jgi:hypothetical protein